MSGRNRIPKSTKQYLERKSRRVWRTALYARLSEENNGYEDDRSLKNQIKYLHSYIDNHPDLIPADCYIDNGRSGLNFERAEFRRMMEDIKDGRINCVIVKDLSRFGRNHIEAGYYLETIFPELGIRFISVNDGFDSLREDDSDSLILPLKNMINEMYARETQRKVLAVLRAKEKLGERPFTMVPYGYVVDPECNYHLLPDPNTSGFVRQIFRMKSEGEKLTGIADYLNEIHAPTPLEYLKSQGKYAGVPSSGRWDYAAVQHILSNRIYTGATVYNTMGKGEYTVIPDTHEALVSVEVFEKIQNCRKKPEIKTCTGKFPNVLKGKFFCRDCGRAMLYDRSSNNFRYRCGGYSDYRKTDPGAPPCAVKLSCVPEQRVYKFILDEIRAALRSGGYKNLLPAEIPDETVGTIHLTDSSCVEIVATGNPDKIEKLLRQGVTADLVSDFVEKIFYNSDGSLRIELRKEDLR